MIINRNLFFCVILLIAITGSCTSDSTMLFPIKDSLGNIGFIDRQGKVIIAPQFHESGGFADGLALVRKNDKFGYIDTKGRQVVALSFPYAKSFSGGFAVVGKGEFAGGGKEIPAHGYPPYKFRGKFGYIDTSGKQVIECRFGLANDFSCGLAVIGEGTLYYDVKVVRGCNPYTKTKFGFKGKYGYIDKTGNAVIQPVYDEAHSFVNGLALVKLNGKSRYIDNKGNTVWEEK